MPRLSEVQMFMSKSALIAVACAATLASAQAASSAPAMPTTPEQWRAAAMRDIEAGYQVTMANHAGARDPHNPMFLANLDAAKVYGASLAAKVNDGGGYYASLLGFSSRIHDGHAGVYPTFMFKDVKPLQWPGFVPAWRGDMYVHAAEGGAAEPGERIVSCDGTPIRTLLEKNVFKYQGRMEEEGQWWSHSRYLFLDFGNPFAPRPQRCVFEHDGRLTERTLAWRAMPDTAIPWGRASVTGDALPVGLTEPRARLFWVAMPTFTPSDKERDDYRAIFRQIRTQRERFLDADAVVVDLRRNQGGDSMWSREFAAALWGEARVARREAARDKNVEVWYRASPGNIAHFAKLKEENAALGEAAKARQMAALVANLRAARSSHKPYYIQKDAVASIAAPLVDKPGDPAPFTRPVYVIVPGDCASSCLDAIDYFKLFTNTRLIGAPSSADSTYMEIRTEILPGGLARVIVPTKLYVNRKRANGEFYRPDIPVNSLRWDTDIFRQVVEQDLGNRSPN